MMTFISALLLQFWKPLAAIAGAGLVAAAIFVSGFQYASQRCHEAELRVEIAGLKLDLAIEKQAHSDADAMARDLAAQLAQLEKENADAEANRPPAPDCRYSPGDLEWMHKRGR